jgi:S-(hydroxymethyl)glutathione dehydrogenase/alcohol dehydrogenase
MNLPQTFKASVLVELNQPLQTMELCMPKPAKGQVLVKIKMAGICRSQLMEATGQRGKDKYLPHLLGHEGVAEVVAVGEGITKVKVNQRVILGWLKGNGLDSGGTTLLSKDGTVINSGPVTTFSEYSIVSENRLTICPEHISDTLAVLLGCALPTGAGMVLNQIKPEKSATIVLIGAGGIGLSALMMLQHFQPKNIVVIDLEQSKLDLAKKIGAHEVYLYSTEGKKLLAENHPAGFDYAIESAGSCETIEFAFSLIHNKGKCFFASHPANGEKIHLNPHELICGKQIFGTWGGNSYPDTDLPVIANIIHKLNIQVDELIQEHYNIDQINEALTDLAERKIVRALIDF